MYAKEHAIDLFLQKMWTFNICANVRGEGA
jgi:hypothetical protein